MYLSDSDDVDPLEVPLFGADVADEAPLLEFEVDGELIGLEVALDEDEELPEDEDEPLLLPPEWILQVSFGWVPSTKYMVSESQLDTASFPLSVHTSTSTTFDGLERDFSGSVECIFSITSCHALTLGFPLTPASESDDGLSKPYHTAPT